MKGTVSRRSKNLAKKQPLYSFVNHWFYERKANVLQQMAIVKAANSVYFPPELVEVIDEAMRAQGGFSSRAEYVRHCVRAESFKIIRGD